MDVRAGGWHGGAAPAHWTSPPDTHTGAGLRETPLLTLKLIKIQTMKSISHPLTLVNDFIQNVEVILLCHTTQ